MGQKLVLTLQSATLTRCAGGVQCLAYENPNRGAFRKRLHAEYYVGSISVDKRTTLEPELTFSTRP